MSSKDGYVKTSIPFINKLFKYKIFIVLSNWTFQGMLYADKTEKLFRIAIDFIISVILYLIIIRLIFIPYLVMLLSVFFAHTLNWIFNGQLFVLGRYIGITPNKEMDFSKYIGEFKLRIRKEKSIKLVALYGSISREELSESSDLDVRIIRKRGLWNGLSACLFGFSERTRALFNKFPLDLYVIDSEKHLSKIRTDEEAIIVYDALKRK